MSGVRSANNIFERNKETVGRVKSEDFKEGRVQKVKI